MNAIYQRSGLFGLASLLCFSCGQRTKSTGESAGSMPDTVLVNGIYTYSRELSSFLECGNDSTTYWLADPDSLLGTEAREFQFFPTDRNSVFAELEAVKLPSQEGESLAAQYDSTLKVIRVLNVSAKSFQTDCFPFDFWCLGNEPFWSVEISGGENIIRLYDLGTESAYYYQYVEPAVEGNTHTYDIPAEAEQPPMKITVKEENCSDGMSDRTYDYSVTVSTGDRTLEGCAIAGEGVP